MESKDNNKTFSEGFKKVLYIFLRYGNKKRSSYSAEEFKTVTTQFRKDKEEYLICKMKELRKQNSPRYTDERVINTLELSYELEKKYYSQKDKDSDGN